MLISPKEKSIIFFLLFTLSTALNLYAQESEVNIDPVYNNDERWRIGYYEGGHLEQYTRDIIATIKPSKLNNLIHAININFNH